MRRLRLLWRINHVLFRKKAGFTSLLLIPCPNCGERPELEFAYGGEANIARPKDPSALTDAEWGEFLYQRSNPRGLHAERWRHIHGCGRFFNIKRNTVTDLFEAAP